ncbi:MAG: hypothetical protein QW812_04280 [Thermoplasmataceae archaeon]
MPIVFPSRKLLAVIVAVLVIALVAYEVFDRLEAGAKIPEFRYISLQEELGTQFDPGSIQAFGYNNTSLLISGLGPYNKSTDSSLPNLEEIDSLNIQPGKNMDSAISEYFGLGSVFGTNWNGSAWLLTGQLSYGDVNVGSVVSYEGNRFTNLTPRFSTYFQRGGAWIDGWNGSAWIVAGNSDNRASLVEYSHGSVVNLTGLLGNTPVGSWIQFVLWNGSAWFLGGHLIFGFLNGDRYTNLLSLSPFADSGALSGLYVDGEWIIGGGPPAGAVIVKGQSITEAFHPPAYLNMWINGIADFNGYIFLGGKGMTDTGLIHPALYIYRSLSSFNNPVNQSAEIPASFNGGQIQFMETIDFHGVQSLFIAGQGNYNEETGYSTGALCQVLA